MEEIIINLKLLILESLKDNKQIDSNFQVYAFTNENIGEYLSKLELKEKNKVLSVCSSGDHLFNLKVLSIKDIDLIDINPLTEYYVLGLRKSMILTYSFSEYREIINFLYKNNKEDIEKEKSILYNLLNYMPKKYQIFWSQIFDYYFELQEKYHSKIKLLQILTLDYYFNLEEITFYNKYLQKESEYLKLKKALLEGEINFINKSIFDINSSDVYDLILCSNALEHTCIPELNINKLKELYNNLINSLRGEGIILASYIYGFYNKYEKSYRSFPIGGSDITDRELLKEELLYIDSYHRSDKDAVLILHK